MPELEWNGDKEYPRKRGSKESFPIADLVSLESVVNILIRKGLCTPEELYQEEQKRRREFEETQDVPLVQTNREAHGGANGAPPNSKSSWLKRLMVKRRWTRRLATYLFGWEWKKVKVEHGKPKP